MNNAFHSVSNLRVGDNAAYEEYNDVGMFLKEKNG